MSLFKYCCENLPQWMDGFKGEDQDKAYKIIFDIVSYYEEVVETGHKAEVKFYKGKAK